MKNNFLKIGTLCLGLLTINACKKSGGDTVKPTTPTVDYSKFTLKTANPAVKFGSLIYINSTKLPPVDMNTYKNTIIKEFGACQSSWFPGFNIGWKSPNTYDFTKFNENVNFMVENKITPMMHLLFGPNFYEPYWLWSQGKTFTNAELEALMYDMIDKIMESNDNKNKVEVWNVINELFEKDGKYRAGGTGEWNIIWNQLGYEDDKSGLTFENKVNDKHPIFIRKVFEYCRKKTSKKLELRDYGLESNNANNGFNFKHKAIYQLIKHMKNSNIPIDALGIQGHHELGTIGTMISSFEVEDAFKRYKDLGIDVYVTELDFPTKSEGAAMTTAEIVQQKTDYTNYIKQAVRGGVTIINTWGIYDNGEAGNWYVDCSPLLWDKNFVKKASYDGAIRGLYDSRKP